MPKSQKCHFIKKNIIINILNSGYKKAISKEIKKEFNNDEFLYKLSNDLTDVENIKFEENKLSDINTDYKEETQINFGIKNDKGAGLFSSNMGTMGQGLFGDNNSKNNSLFSNNNNTLFGNNNNDNNTLFGKNNNNNEEKPQFGLFNNNTSQEEEKELNKKEKEELKNNNLNMQRQNNEENMENINQQYPQDKPNDEIGQVITDTIN